MNILAIIPARGGSKGVPHKNIKLLAGKPLITYSIEAAKGSKYIDRVVVSTDDGEISKISKKYGAEVILRPEDLAQDESPTLDAVIHSLNVLEEDDYYADLIVLLQPTSPLRTSQNIDNATEILIDKFDRCDSVVSVCEFEHSPYWALKIEAGYLKPAFGDRYFKLRRQELPEIYMPNGSIFISKKDILLKHQNFYSGNVMPYFMSTDESVDIDTEMDFKIAETILGESYGN